MKILLLFLMTTLTQFAFAQEKSALIHKDRDIRNLLAADLSAALLPDSVTVYSFYIRITPKKRGVNDVYLSSPLAGKLFPNIDSLLSSYDFAPFLKGSKQKFVVLPVGVLVVAHNKMAKGSAFNVYELTKSIPNMLAEMDPDRYQSVFLTPYFVIVDNKSVE